MQLTTALSWAVLALTATAVPVSNPVDVINKRAGPAAGVVINRCVNPKQLALAYDDGVSELTQTLVNNLNAGGAKGTFFVTGKLYQCIYNKASALKSAYNSGHQIASHSWTHPQNFGSLSSAQLTTEMQKTEQAFVNIIGKKPTYMRPPYLQTGGAVLSTMKSLGYRVITSDVDSEDWNGKTVAQSQQKFTQAGAGGNGHITLMHETYSTTVNDLTKWAISWAKQNGLKLVTVAECLGDANGAYQPQTFTGNGQNTCN